MFLGWAQVWCENRAAGSRAAAGADQPALARPLPRQRRRLEHAGVPEGVLVQGRRADGAAECSAASGRRNRDCHGSEDLTAERSRSAAVSAATSSRANRCPRLRAYCQRVAREKRRAYRDETYWAQAGARLRRSARAAAARRPRARGARRQPHRPRLHRRRRRRLGRLPDGRAASRRLRQHPHLAVTPTMGSTLRDAFIAAAVRCAPPDNKPTPEEIASCLPHLDAEIAALPRVRVVVALGRIGFDAYLQTAETSRRGRAAAAGLWPRARTPAAERPDAHRLLPSQPSEHQHRQAHAVDDGRRASHRATHASAVIRATNHEVTKTRSSRWRERRASTVLILEAAIDAEESIESMRVLRPVPREDLYPSTVRSVARSMLPPLITQTTFLPAS